MKTFLSFSRAITWIGGEQNTKRSSRDKKQKRYHINYQLWFNILMKQHKLF